LVKAAVSNERRAIERRAIERRAVSGEQ